MPKKVTTKIVSSFLSGKSARDGNTTTDGKSLYLHGNEIAKMERGKLWISNAGWFSSTTKERLNALPGVSISQKAGEWYLNGKKWDGDWVKINTQPTTEIRRTVETKVKNVLMNIIREQISNVVKNRRRLVESLPVNKSDPKNIETGVSNLFLKGAGYDINGNLRVIVGFPNDRGTSIQVGGSLPKTQSIISSNGGRYVKLHKLTDEEIKTIGREVTEYMQEYGSSNIKKRLSVYSESILRSRSGRILEAYGLHPDVIRQYLETALWSSNDESDEYGGESFDANYDIEDIAPESIAQAERDIEKFIKMADDEGVLNPYLDAFTGPSWGNLGHDFWLTRNGHGAGFWDRNEIDEEVGRKLTDIARKFKEVYPVLGDDGKIYFE